MANEEKGAEAVEMSAIKEDFQKLEGDIKEMLRTLSSQGKEKLAETKVRLEGAIRSLKGNAQEKLGDAYDCVREHSQQAMEISRKKIEERPLTAVFAAFVAGILFTKLIDRR